MSDQKTVFIKSYGCQMNVYDAERMQDVLAPMGYKPVETAEDADLVLLNTCHIREKAAEKVYSELGKLKLLKKEREGEGKELVIGVAGCVAQAEGSEIVRRAPAVDLVVGPQSYQHLPSLLKDLKEHGRRKGGLIETEFPVDDKFDHMPSPNAARLKASGPTAFLTVQEGCDKFCSFCVVPYTRGAEVSRPAVKILSEARDLVAAGVKEITLLGQNVNAYHGEGPDGDAWSLARLLYALADVPGIARLRYVTSHPRDMGDDLITAHRDLDLLMPYLHLPVQAGADSVLKAMNRKHTRDDYFRLIDKVRTARPDIALSGDFIVGFPGESDADFRDTMDLIKRVGYASAYSFKYSPRPGTPASTNEQLAEEIKSTRLAELQELINSQQRAFHQSLVGTTMDVLFEKTGRLEGQLVGRAPYLMPVNVQAQDGRIGDIVKVMVTAAGANSLMGELVVG